MTLCRDKLINLIPAFYLPSDPKQNKKRLMFLLFLFLLSIVFTALMVYFLGDDLYANNFKELFEQTADITIPSKK
jgi:hypothetical protein